MKDDILGSDNEKVDKMEVDEENGNNSNNLEQPKQTTTLQSAMNNQLETGVDALDDILEDSCKRIAETEAEIPQPKTVDIGQEKLKPKRRKKKKKKSLEANTATCELDATPLVTNPASRRYKKKSIIHDGVSDGEDTASLSAASKLVTPTIPALQPKACDNSKPVVETIVESAQLNDRNASAETTQRKKRKIIDIESSDSESEFVDVVQTQAPKPNITLPQAKKKQSWKLKRKTIRIDCRREKQHAALNETPQTITHSLHKQTIEGLECLLWSLRDQLTKIQSMEYVAAWRHGKYFMTAWNSNADLVQETYYQVKMLESAYDSCGDSLLRNQILSLVEVALHECKAHTSIFNSVHQRLVSGAQMEMSPTLALFVQAQYSDFLETHTVSPNNQMMEKCNLVRSEIVTLWGLVDSWWTQREESENEEDGSISVYVRKREQLNMVKILMRYGTQCNNTVDFDEVEQFQTHLDENKFKEIGRERVRVKLLGLIGLYRILMTSII
ncbi:hypothetical protein BDR26DRAFT_855247 [Obelidium mucronatum]|nr:hypothetical protein BDR26DRAFT_855247 [Obelidium mucronatum]